MCFFTNSWCFSGVYFQANRPHNNKNAPIRNAPTLYINYLLRKKNLIPMSKEIAIKIYSSISLNGAFVYLGIKNTKAIKTQKPAILIMLGLSPLLRLMNILVLENFFFINLKTINTHTMYPIRTIVEKDTYSILEFNNNNKLFSQNINMNYVRMHPHLIK